MSKPLPLALEDARKDLNIAIEQIANVHGMPCYLLELILSDALSRIKDGKQKELELVKQSSESEVQSDV